MGKTTVIAMLIAWQAINVRHLGSKQFSKAFLIITSGITIRDRLQVLLPSDPESYFRNRELVPTDMLREIESAKIVITNYHAFALRETMGVSKAVQPNGVGLIIRSPEQLDRALAATHAAKFPYVTLSDSVLMPSGSAAISPMHLAKGLEFRPVAVIACDDEVLPLHNRMEDATDESDLKEVYTTERHLLYVACTRARERLLITAIRPVSEFL